MPWVWVVTMLQSVEEPALMDEVVQEPTDEGVQRASGMGEESGVKLLDVEQLDDHV